MGESIHTYTSDNGFLSKTYEELIYLNKKGNKTQQKNKTQ